MDSKFRGFVGRLERSSPVIAAVALVVLVVGLWSAAPQARGARGDVAAQLDIIDRQLDITREQLDVTREQLSRMDRQLDLQQRQLAVTEEQLAEAAAVRRLTEQTLAVGVQVRDLAEQNLAVVRSGDRKLAESLVMQRRLVEIAEALLAVTRQINDKAPESGRAVP